MSAVRLSALVCVNGHEAQLADCLRTLAFCDEVVVVADRCTDPSRQIARRNAALVIDGIFPFESQRKIAGAQACTGDWILEIEPDEQVSSALAWEIRAMLQRRPAGDYFEVPIDNYIGSTLVRHGWTDALAAARSVRLYRRGKKHWQPRAGRARALLSGAPAGALKGAVRRTLGHDLGAAMDRLNALTARRAEEIAGGRSAGRLSNGLARGAMGFFKSYLVRGGWREGRMGVLLALMTGLHPVITELRARELRDARAQAMGLTARGASNGEVVGLR
jgi:hypothetical protein